MNNFTEQELQEIEAVESHFGTYGSLVAGAFDTRLTSFQRQHCQRVLKAGMGAFHEELAAEHGARYPLSALAEKIDAGIKKHTIQREVSA